MRYIRSNKLNAGMVVASPLYDDSGRLMLAANSILTGPLVRRLRALGFHGAYILDGRDDGAYRPLLDENLRQEAIKKLKVLDIDQVLYVANAITNQVLDMTGRLYDMQAVCSYDQLTYLHSVNVAVLSVMMGVGLGMWNQDLLMLGQGALLHDIGKTKVSPEIIKGRHRLSDQEFQEVRRHPEHGHAMLAGNPLVPEHVRLAVLHHHENEDGTGYPYKLKSDEIPEYAKVIHVADVYDALVSARSYKKRMNPADALENLMAGAGTQFDLRCVTALKDNVALYPVGREVVLSNGLHAYVQENHKGYPARPLVQTATGTRIDLMQQLDVTVTGFAD